MSLPKFTKPPVTEVALSVQFDRIETSNTQLGFVWQKYRYRFPGIEEKPEIEATLEKFGDAKISTPGIQFKVESTPSFRYWFVGDDGSELLQIQRDRFVRNWRKKDENHEYPHYENVRKSFLSDWDIFADFADKELGIKPIINQCEVTYVNIIDGIIPGDIDQLYSFFGETYSGGYLGKPEEADLRIRFLLKNETATEPWGRLHVSTSSVMRVGSSETAIRLTLTVRGKPRGPKIDDTLEIFDAAHETIVRGFTSITTKKMHEKWGRSI